MHTRAMISVFEAFRARRTETRQQQSKCPSKRDAVPNLVGLKPKENGAGRKSHGMELWKGAHLPVKFALDLVYWKKSGNFRRVRVHSLCNKSFGICQFDTSRVIHKKCCFLTRLPIPLFK
jgi:hypothetical protein